MIAVAVVAILATIALPGLYDSRVRDQVVEAAPLIDLAKKRVNAVWTGGGTLPADNTEAGLPPPSKMVGNTVKSVTVRNGVVDVVFGNNASAAITDKVLTLRPAVVDDAPMVPVAWVCGRAAAPPGMSVRGDDRTSLPSTALPVNCRS